MEWVGSPAHSQMNLFLEHPFPQKLVVVHTFYFYKISNFQSIIAQISDFSHTALQRSELILQSTTFSSQLFSTDWFENDSLNRIYSNKRRQKSLLQVKWEFT